MMRSKRIELLIANVNIYIYIYIYIFFFFLDESIKFSLGRLNLLESHVRKWTAYSIQERDLHFD